MSKLEKAAKEIFAPLRWGVNESLYIAGSIDSNNLDEILTLPIRLKMAAAPLTLVLALYGATGYGVVKGSKFLYDRAKEEVIFRETLRKVSDIKTMALPPEYGGMKRK